MEARSLLIIAVLILAALVKASVEKSRAPGAVKRPENRSERTASGWRRRRTRRSVPLRRGRMRRSAVFLRGGLCRGRICRTRRASYATIPARIAFAHDKAQRIAQLDDVSQKRHHRQGGVPHAARALRARTISHKRENHSNHSREKYEEYHFVYRRGMLRQSRAPAAGRCHPALRRAASRSSPAAKRTRRTTAWS